MDDVALANYFAGLETGPLDGGALVSAIARALGVPAGTRVRVSDYTLTKIQIRHPDMGFREWVALPVVLASGFVVRGDRKRPSVECCYFDPAGMPFTAAKLAIKVTAAGEAYVTTYHRLTLTEAKRIYRRALRRGALVRGLKEELAQLLAAPVT